MKSSFRYVDATVDDLVTLFLFVDRDGEARARVTGPCEVVSAHEDAAPDATSPLPLSKAFALAIRMANRNDVEIVVSGDRTLWQSDWGDLTKMAPHSPQGLKIERTGQILRIGRM